MARLRRINKILRMSEMVSPATSPHRLRSTDAFPAVIGLTRMRDTLGRMKQEDYEDGRMGRPEKNENDTI